MCVCVRVLLTAPLQSFFNRLVISYETQMSGKPYVALFVSLHKVDLILNLRIQFTLRGRSLVRELSHGGLAGSRLPDLGNLLLEFFKKVFIQ